MWSTSSKSSCYTAFGGEAGSPQYLIIAVRLSQEDFGFDDFYIPD